MPTNNPNYQSSSQTSKGGADGKNKIESGIEQGGQRVEKTIERIEKGAEQAASSALNRVREVREQATSGVAQQRDLVAHRIRRIGDVLHGGGEMLAEEDVWVRDAMEYASERANGLADYVSEVTPAAVVDDLKSFASRRPGLFFGGAFLIGLALGRFAKSSTGSGSGGNQNDVDAYGDAEDDELESRSLQTKRRGASSSASKPESVSTGIGANASSASYGASTATGAESSSAPRPSYGTSVGGTGGYGAPASPGAPLDTSPSQTPPREAPSGVPASPRAHAVKPGEGSKS